MKALTLATRPFPMRRIFPVLIALVILLLLPVILNARTAALCSGEPTGRKIVPFELIDNRIFVNFRFNGQGPFHCIFDTGADAAIDRDVVKQLGLIPSGAFQTSGTGDKTVDAANVRVSLVDLDGMELHDYDFVVLDNADSKPVFGSVRVDGIIGLGYLRAYAVSIDYVKHLMTFTPASEFHYAGDGTVVAIRRVDPVPVIEAELDSVAGRFGVDTGARTSLILTGPFVAKNKLKEKYAPNVEGITGWGIGGPIRTDVARARTLKMGAPGAAQPEVKDIVIRLSKQRGGILASGSIAGLIGPDVLKQFIVTFDYRRDRMIMEKSGLYGRSDTYDRSGMWIVQGEHSFTVLDVVSNGPAEAAGMRIGDVIMAIDGIPTEQLVLPVVRDRFRYDPPGTRIPLRIQSNGKTKDILLTLKDIV